MPDLALPSPRSSWVLGCALTTAIVASACSHSFQPTAPPTVAETQAFVRQVVRLAKAGEFDQLCKIGGGNCIRILAAAGAQNVPSDPPTIARIYVVPSMRHADGSWSQGGQMVEMCGTGVNGAPYQTQMLVFRDQGDRLISIEPIYWSGLSINVDTRQPVGPATHPAFAC